MRSPVLKPEPDDSMCTAGPGRPRTSSGGGVMRHDSVSSKILHTEVKH